ncbi:MAG: hypothetical protein F6J87_25395 [Spirulina sp. SIO3F2]|nr:hypothetical protein [Spirulina sp. SIO3F2]
MNSCESDDFLALMNQQAQVAAEVLAQTGHIQIILDAHAQQHSHSTEYVHLRQPITAGRKFKVQSSKFKVSV